MNRIEILFRLSDTADNLEAAGLFREAVVLTNVMKRMAQVAQTQQPGNMQQLLNESKRLSEEFTKYSDKVYNLFLEINRKIDAGLPLKRKNGVLNAPIMMNQMIAYMQPLADKIKNINVQLGYDPKYNETTQEMLNVMRQYSNNINNKYTSKKRTQPAQQPVKPQ